VTVSAYQGPPTAAVEQVAARLRAAGINTNVVPDGHRALWEKACLLMPIAAMTSVCRSGVGPIRDLPETLALADEIISEAVSVGQAAGYELSAAEQRARGMVRNVPPAWKASMARDFERGRRTELEAIIGALVRRADALGVPVPTSRAVYAILKLRAQTEAGTAEQVGIGAAGR
jgi:2-dehydropantoate 2-reductase